MKKKMVGMMMVVCLTLGMMGCQASSGDVQEQDTTATEEKEEVKAEDTSSEEARFAWYGSMPHPYFEEVMKGVERFEEKNGVTVEKKLGPDWDQKSETENVEALVAQGYNYISVYPNDTSGAVSMYKEMADMAGTTFVSYGAATAMPTEAKFLVATDVKQAAYDATEYVIKQMGEKGNILNVLEVLEDSNTQLRKEGVEECVANYPNVQIIQEVSNMKTADEAAQKIEAALSANLNDIDGIVCTGFTTTQGLASTLMDVLDRNPDKVIYSIGIDNDDTITKAIKEGYMSATIGQNPRGMGEIPLTILKHLSEGWVPVEDQYYINSGTFLVTTDNIDNFQDEADAITEDILSRLETEYLTKP